MDRDETIAAHEQRENHMAANINKLHHGLVRIFMERDSNYRPIFKDKQYTPPSSINMRTISEGEFERLYRLDKVIDEVRNKLYKPE